MIVFLRWGCNVVSAAAACDQSRIWCGAHATPPASFAGNGSVFRAEVSDLAVDDNPQTAGAKIWSALNAQGVFCHVVGVLSSVRNLLPKG